MLMAKICISELFVGGMERLHFVSVLSFQYSDYSSITVLLLHLKSIFNLSLCKWISLFLMWMWYSFHIWQNYQFMLRVIFISCSMDWIAAGMGQIIFSAWWPQEQWLNSGTRQLVLSMWEINKLILFTVQSVFLSDKRFIIFSFSATSGAPKICKATFLWMKCSFSALTQSFWYLDWLLVPLCAFPSLQ